MQQSDIDELHFIAPIASLSSMLNLGILSNFDSRGLPHASVADPDVQERRASRSIPGGLKLHRYANLYFNARNAMLYKILNSPDVSFRMRAEELTILRIAPSILDCDGVVITDINAAAREEPRWHSVDDGIAQLDSDEIFAKRWNRGDYWEQIRRRQRMMAEVLVPRRVPPEFIVGAYVDSDLAAANVSVAASTLSLKVKPYMFFQGPQS